MRQLDFPTVGSGGVALYGQAWLPQAPPRAVVVVAHGLAEHSGRYQGLAECLVMQRYAVYAIDHRGHGRSAGPRANIGRFAHLVSDFSTFAGRAAREHPDAPVFLLGHSMGGAVAFASAGRLQGALRGLVLSAPALAVAEAATPLKLALVRALSVIAPNTGALTLPATAVSRDAAVVQAYESDPLVFRRALPARTLAELLAAMAGFADQARRLRLPVLIQHGSADSLVPLGAAREIYHQIPASDRTVQLYEGLFHEIYNEPERERVIADLLDWLGAHLPR